jgi:hypothetical protein
MKGTRSSQEPQTVCRSEEFKMLDLCRTGGCCPVARVYKNKVVIEENGKHIVTLTKQQIDEMSMEMRRL